MFIIDIRPDSAGRTYVERRTRRFIIDIRPDSAGRTYVLTGMCTPVLV